MLLLDETTDLSRVKPAIWLGRIDHVTYVAQAENEASFIARWRAVGFREHMRLRTQRFPAWHIALTSGADTGYAWGAMTGLSVSEDPRSPINEFVRRYGEGIQHTAYNTDPDIDMALLQHNLEQQGWRFLTPVLTYRDAAGARLKQLFTAPNVPYGSFVEFVQRLPGDNGSPFDAFDTQNIDDLYACYADYSRWLAA